MDTISQNKNTVTSLIDALFTKGDLGAVDEYLAEDFVDHDPPMGGPADWPSGRHAHRPPRIDGFVRQERGEPGSGTPHGT